MMPVIDAAAGRVREVLKMRRVAGRARAAAISLGAAASEHQDDDDDNDVVGKIRLSEQKRFWAYVFMGSVDLPWVEFLLLPLILLLSLFLPAITT